MITLDALVSPKISVNAANAPMVQPSKLATEMARRTLRNAARARCKSSRCSADNCGASGGSGGGAITLVLSARRSAGLTILLLDAPPGEDPRIIKRPVVQL